MMWILIHSLLPVHNAPPKLSIHWSIPNESAKYKTEAEKDWFWEDVGSTPDWSESRIIHFEDQDITVFPHEFNLMDESKWQDYVYGGHASHVLIGGLTSAPSQKLVDLTQDSDLKALYEYAILEGANDSVAKLITVGDLNPMDDTGEPFPMGWYCVRPEYAVYLDSDVQRYFPEHPYFTGASTPEPIMLVQFKEAPHDENL